MANFKMNHKLREIFPSLTRWNYLSAQWEKKSYSKWQEQMWIHSVTSIDNLHKINVTSLGPALVYEETKHIVALFLGLKLCWRYLSEHCVNIFQILITLLASIHLFWVCLKTKIFSHVKNFPLRGSPWDKILALVPWFIFSIMFNAWNFRYGWR